MDEAARQTSSHSLSSASSSSATVRRSGSSQRQHRRTGSVGTVSEHEVNRDRWGTNKHEPSDIVISRKTSDDGRFSFVHTDVFSVFIYWDMATGVQTENSHLFVYGLKQALFSILSWLFRCAHSSTPHAPPSPQLRGFLSTRLLPWTRWTVFFTPVNQTLSSPRWYLQLEPVITAWRYVFTSNNEFTFLRVSESFQILLK